MVAGVAQLVQSFAADAASADGAGWLSRDSVSHPDRRLLAALLTTRSPRPIPEELLRDLENLLEQERDARGVIEVTSIPTLSEQGVATGRLPADRVAFWEGDLTRLRADAIVNAANSQMLGCFVPDHRCIDNAIHAAAGPRLRAECAAHITKQGEDEPTGRAVVTNGYVLPASFVLHTVGPIVRGPLTDRHRSALASSYRSILDAAEHHPLISTVGLCSISTGVFGFPKEAAAAICLSELTAWFSEHPTSTLRVVVSLYADVDVRAYQLALAEMTA